ncbi:MAG: hypothetical protein OHK0046_17620 [Anaerolineae bacterium]
MGFQQLHDWDTTSRALHQASMLLGPIQNALFTPRSNYLHLPMFVEPTGLVSQTMPQGGHIHVNYRDAAIRYVRSNGTSEHFLMADHTQASLFEALLAALRQDELADFFADVDAETLTAGMMTKLHADNSRKEFLRLEDVTHADPLTLNAQTAGDYMDVLYTVYTAVARFRARLTGHMTPVVVWAEHFDLSTLWFHPGNPTMDDSKAHMNFGFAPFSSGYDLPYLYVYIYPYPEGFEPPALPEPAIWNREGWTGVAVRYDDMAKQADAAQFIETMCLDLFALLSPYLNAGLTK